MERRQLLQAPPVTRAGAGKDADLHGQARTPLRQRPIIYTAPDFYDDNLKGTFTDYPFWLRAVAQHPSKVYPGRRWLFWQYSGSGLSQGVNEKIDLNVFHGSEDEWHRWVGRVTS
ncbi:glycosyl hydrolase [Brucella pinnipedialis M292/94/1]|uniref:Glycosyl hydrolase n=1 Tax=Brucella pinnipedialis M292/94/1 TaxID=520462 RepID=A0A0E1X7F5_9HYPH|nr:glycosyl hydrolase [Brucella pinnipedialis M292/94/1]